MEEKQRGSDDKREHRERRKNPRQTGAHCSAMTRGLLRRSSEVEFYICAVSLSLRCHLFVVVERLVSVARASCRRLHGRNLRPLRRRGPRRRRRRFPVVGRERGGPLGCGERQRSAVGGDELAVSENDRTCAVSNRRAVYMQKKTKNRTWLLALPTHASNIGLTLVWSR